MINLLDPVPLAVIILIVTSFIVSVVLLTGGKKKAPAAQQEARVPAVEKKHHIVKEIPAVSDPETQNVTSSAPTEEETPERVGGVTEVLSVPGQIEDAVETQQEQPVETALFEELVDEIVDAPMNESEQPDEAAESEQEAQTENLLETDPEAEQEPADEECEASEEQNEQYDEFNEYNEEDVAEYDESEYNPEDLEETDEQDQDQEGRESYQEDEPADGHSNTLTLDTTSDTAEGSPRSPTKRTPTSARAEGLSPMSNSYQFGSHYQHKKVGASWVKNSNTAASAAAASPVTVSPVRHSQPRKVIPVSDQEQPLSRKQSTKISQYEEGLQAEKTKVSNKVLETRRRTIEDVVHRVLLDGEELPSEVDPAALIADPAEVSADVNVKTKKIVKQMQAKFASSSANSGSAGSSAGVSTGGVGGRSVSADEE